MEEKLYGVDPTININKLENEFADLLEKNPLLKDLLIKNKSLQQELTTLKQEKEELNAVCRVYEKGLDKKKNQITALQKKIDKAKEYVTNLDDETTARFYGISKQMKDNILSKLD